MRVRWTTKRFNQSILKEISPEYSLEGLMLKLKLQSFGHLMRRTDSLEKTLMLGKIAGGREGDNRWCDGWMASPTWWTQVWSSSREVGNGLGSLTCCSPWDRKEADMTEWLNRTEVSLAIGIWGCGVESLLTPVSMRADPLTVLYIKCLQKIHWQKSSTTKTNN